MKRYLIIYQGRVQGVGFRFQCQMAASQYHLTGFAENLENGDVHVEVQGQEENINKFIQTIIKGNRFIRIDDYSCKEIPIKDEKRFLAK